MYSEVCLNFGLHMAIQALHIVKHINQPIVLHILRNDQIRKYRNDFTDEDFKNYEKFMQFLFEGTAVIIKMQKNDLPTFEQTFGSETACKFYTINCLSHLSKPDYPLLGEKYVTINTKLTPTITGDYSYLTPTYHRIKSQLYDILNSSNFPVVILGERAVGDCFEYKVLHDNFEMYTEHIKNLKNVVDVTYSESKKGYDIEEFSKTCNYLNNSVLNIFIGNGGGIHLYCSFPNTCQLGVFDRLLENIPLENIKTNPITTKSGEEFISNVSKKLLNLK